LVALVSFWDLLDHAKDLFVEAISPSLDDCPDDTNRYLRRRSAILRMVAAPLPADVDLGPERERAQDEH
jgi:hypothetical protein